MTGFQIRSFFFTSESRSLYALSESMPRRDAGLRPDPHREENLCPAPMVWALYLISHPVGPEIQSILWKFSIFTSKYRGVLCFNQSRYLKGNPSILHIEAPPTLRVINTPSKCLLSICCMLGSDLGTRVPWLTRYALWPPSWRRETEQASE